MDYNSFLATVAFGRITFAAGVPSLLYGQGVVGVTDNGDGDTTLTLDAESAVDGDQAQIYLTAADPGAASGLVSLHVVNVDDTNYRVTTLQEQAAGAASILADVDFYFEIKRIRQV